MNDVLFGLRTGTAFAADYHRHIRPRLAELEALRKRSLAQIAGIWAAGVPLAALIAFGLLYVHGFLAILALVGGIWGTRWLAGQQLRRYSEAVKNLVMPPVCAFIGDLAYTADPGGQAIDPAPFDALRLLPGYRRMAQEDHFRGSYRDRRFQLVEVTLHSQRGTGKSRRTVVVFRGLMIVIDVAEPPPGRLVIGRPAGMLLDWIDGWAASWQGMSRVALGDAAFDDLFRVYGDTPATAQALLTPTVRAGLVEIARERGPRSFALGFDGHRLLVALEAGPLFEAGGLLRRAERLEEDIARVLREVTIPHRLIDHLSGGRPGPL